MRKVTCWDGEGRGFLSMWLTHFVGYFLVERGVIITIFKGMFLPYLA